MRTVAFLFASLLLLLVAGLVIPAFWLLLKLLSLIVPRRFYPALFAFWVPTAMLGVTAFGKLIELLSSRILGSGHSARGAGQVEDYADFDAWLVIALPGTAAALAAGIVERHIPWRRARPWILGCIASTVYFAGVLVMASARGSRVTAEDWLATIVIGVLPLAAICGSVIWFVQRRAANSQS